MTRVSAFTPPLLAGYAALDMPVTAAADDTLTTAPWLSMRTGIAYLHIRKVPRRFTAITRSNVAVGTLKRSLSSATVMAALFTSAPSRPNAVIVARWSVLATTPVAAARILATCVASAGPGAQ